jgi:ribosome production factor 1
MIIPKIKNKIKRNEIFRKEKQKELKEKLEMKKKRKRMERENPELLQKRLKENQQITLENKRTFDATMVQLENTVGKVNRNAVPHDTRQQNEIFEFDKTDGGLDAPSDVSDADTQSTQREKYKINVEDEVQKESCSSDENEVMKDLDADEFADYLNNTETKSKILLTTSRGAPGPIYEFINEFKTIFPSCQFVKRQSQFDLKRIIEIAIEREYTDLLVVNHDKKKPNGLMIVHLPNGPTAYFKLTSWIPNKNIRGHGKLGLGLPELILNNFKTRLGVTIGRMFSCLFPKNPEFVYRQVVTLHNQRDFIFFRRHRYIFRSGEKVDIQELGPRFCLKLQWLQNGLFDSKYGEYEWIHRPELDTTRSTFHL